VPPITALSLLPLTNKPNPTDRPISGLARLCGVKLVSLRWCRLASWSGVPTKLTNYQATIDNDREGHSPYQFGDSATRIDWSRFFSRPIAAYWLAWVICTTHTKGTKGGRRAERTYLRSIRFSPFHGWHASPLAVGILSEPVIQ